MKHSFSSRVSVAILVVCGSVAGVSQALAQSDTTPPQLVGFTASPTTVDVSAAPATVNTTVHVTDDLAGIDLTTGQRIRVDVMSPSGQQFLGANVPQTGVVTEGTFPVNIVLPRFIEPGVWTLRVFLRDNIGNAATINSAALIAAGFPGTITVIDANPDTTAPVLTAVTLPPNAVDVSGAPVTISGDFSFSDNLSGVSQLLSAIDFTVSSPSGRQRLINRWSNMQMLPGSTTTSGTWRGQFTVPQYAEAGTWTVTRLIVRDAAGNTRFYDPATLSPFGVSIQLTIMAQPTDTTPPTLSDLGVSPLFVDTSVGPASLQATVAATDDLSGVSFAPEAGFLSRFYLQFTSPSGAQSVGFFTFNLSGIPPVSGTPTDGRWDLNVTLPQFSEEGTWKLRVELKDETNNLRLYSDTQLASLGLPSAITVIKPSLDSDGNVDSGGGTVNDPTFGSRASLTIPSGVFAVPTDVAIDVLSSPLGLPLPSGFSTAETYFVNVQLTPQPTFPLPAPGITVVLPLRTYLVPGTQIDLFRVDPVTAQLTPALNTAGLPVVGTVDAGGLSATFAGVARFSTVVGLLPNALPVQILIKPGDGLAALNLTSKGTIPVAILSSPTFDATLVDSRSLRLSGAVVALNPKEKALVSAADADGDGLEDLMAHFDHAGLLLSTTDTSAVVEGRTGDGRLFRGVAAIRLTGKSQTK